MGKSNQREKPRGKSVAQIARRRMYIHMFVLLLVFGAVIAGVFYLFNGKRTAAQSTAPPKAKESVAVPEAKGGFDILKGRWLRPDGGYVIEIKDIGANGNMVAAYFNPRPINVSQAEATLDGTTLKVFIELRDVNYPGATYRLIYDPESNHLRGIYHQPALQQSFKIFFVRMK
jgi:hypothetical protein